jgi:hypothetical protein
MKFQTLFQKVRDLEWIGDRIGAALDATGSYLDFYIWVCSKVLVPVSLRTSSRANIDNAINLIVE